MTTTTTSPAAEKIQKCSAQMLLKSPWFASLFLNLIRVETESVDTMAVDGTHLFFNPEFTMSLTDKECLGVLMHETVHIALLHVYRRKYREPRRWNIAVDKCVNAVLLAANVLLPKGCVPPCSLESTAEEEYEKITANEMELYFSDDVRDACSEPVNGEKQMTEKEWRDILASSRGMMPESIARTVEEATVPRKDWKEELARYIHSTCKSDSRTWTRQSRRVVGLPGWNREIESNIVIVLDTSGSVTGALLSTFAAECRSILALTGITAVIMSADAAVHQVIQPGEEFPQEWKGGGGTDFRPALKAAAEYQPNCVVYLTDGAGTFPKDCPLPVLWALTKPCTVPFGEKLVLEGIE